MATTTMTQEEICDLQGNPLKPAAVTLLTAIDRLLTVSGYYFKNHEQYQQAVDRACTTIIKAIRPRPAMAVEIVANGLILEEQVVGPNLRVARKLHDLLVALNIARLEFSAQMQPAHLREALAILQENRRKLGQAEGFCQISIENLPPTVSIACRRIGKDKPSASLDDLLCKWENVKVTDSGLDPDSQWKYMAREFISLADQLLKNLETISAPQGGREGTGNGTLVSPEVIEALKDSLRRLVEVRPEPSKLIGLIRHVKTALALSNDPGTVDLAFNILRTEMGIESLGHAKPVQQILREDLSFTVGRLDELISDLRERKEPLGKPVPSALTNLVLITLDLLATGPAEPFRSRYLTAFNGAISAPDFGRKELAVVSSVLTEIAANGVEIADRFLPPVLATIRHEHPELLAHLWNQLYTGSPDSFLVLWPHFVNDLLLGLNPAPQSASLHLWPMAGEIGCEHIRSLGPRLSCLSALRGGRPLAGLSDLSLMPVKRLRFLFALLMQSRCANQVGPLLRKGVLRGSDENLTWILMAALDKFVPDHRGLYAALMREHGNDSPSPRLSRLTSAILMDVLQDLKPLERREPWTAKAISWLPRLAGVEARSILARIISGRRYWIFKAWPPPCRRAARSAVARLQATGTS